MALENIQRFGETSGMIGFLGKELFGKLLHQGLGQKKDPIDTLAQDTTSSVHALINAKEEKSRSSAEVAKIRLQELQENENRLFARKLWEEMHIHFNSIGTQLSYMQNFLNSNVPQTEVSYKRLVFWMIYKQRKQLFEARGVKSGDSILEFMNTHPITAEEVTDILARIMNADLKSHGEGKVHEFASEIQTIIDLSNR